ncbi:MAG: tRNA (adenosine(37)-N6)-threonylcarbamoyltransferase complex transferase subunit TsaD, partial [Candidatus Paceibacterota bacterium]
HMKILAIETSCDDTALSILEVTGGAENARFKVLANNTNSQINIHIPYGGVFPSLAKREHIKNLPILLDACLRQAKLEKKRKPVDAIMVTYGPGLEPSLWTGIVFAKELSKKWKVPLVPVNHMEGHIVSVFGKDKGSFKVEKLKTPILSLLVSGGHTQLVLTKKWMDYEIIGETLDDAVGEAFDKVARTLGLPYPGGPQISKLAEGLRQKEKQSLKGPRSAKSARTERIFQQENRDPSNFSFSGSLPRPMLYTKDFNFSFSGLKTAVLYLTKKLRKIDDAMRAQIALEFENAAIECLTYKTAKALAKYEAKTLIVAGGVAANRHLRKEMKKLVGRNIKLLFPTQALSGDNSLMIGIAGYLNYIKNKKKTSPPSKVKATGNLRL